MSVPKIRSFFTCQASVLGCLFCLLTGVFLESFHLAFCPFVSLSCYPVVSVNFHVLNMFAGDCDPAFILSLVIDSPYVSIVIKVLVHFYLVFTINPFFSVVR